MAKKRSKSRSRKVQSRRQRPHAQKPAPAKPKIAVERKTHAAVATVDPLDEFIVAAARTLSLPIESQWLPTIRMNLEVTLRQGKMVDDFTLPDEAEPAPVFEA
jgi:hypothetical protein